MHRFFVPEKNITAGSIIELSAEESWHLVKVLRKQQGNQVNVFNNTGYEFQAEIIGAKLKRAKLKIISGELKDNEPGVELILALSLVKGKKMDWIIQKAVELGAKEIVPVVAPRSIARSQAAEKGSHWSKIVIESTKQCGRTFLAKVHPIVSFSQALQQLSASGLKIIGWEGVARPTLSELLQEITLDRQQTVALFIGPEGGFSQEEISEAQHYGFRPVSLGKRVLRTETAALLAVSIMLSHFGEF